MIIVAGSGIAGICAAIEAARAGSRVILLEKDRVIGGIKINAKSQALDTAGRPIPGLYVAGEDAGRPYTVEHGGLAFGLIFGRIAGKNAAMESPGTP